MEIGVAVPPLSEAHFADLVAAAEDAGVEAFWTYDAGRGEEPFARAGFLAAVTRRTVLCAGIVNPFLRHPAVLAGGAATLDRLSGGRCRLVMGFGWTPDLEHVMGVVRHRPYRDFGASLTVIKRLLAGEEVSYRAEHFALRNARLSLTPIHPNVPIYVAGGGRRGLEIAAATADGYLADFGPDPRYIQWMRERVRRTRGTTEDFRLGVSLAFRIEEDLEEAMASARRSLAWSLATSTSTDPYYEVAGIEPGLVRALRAALGLDDLIREERDPRVAYLDSDRREAAARRIPADLAMELAPNVGLFGSIPYCTERLRTLAVSGVDFVLLHFPDRFSELLPALSDVLRLVRQDGASA
jgi:5,10-methylenetetrahydromethanopterin reductase